MDLDVIAHRYNAGKLYCYRLTDTNKLEAVPGGFLGRGIAWLLNCAGIRTNDQLLCEMIPRLFTDLPEDKAKRRDATRILEHFRETSQDVKVKKLCSSLLQQNPP